MSPVEPTPYPVSYSYLLHMAKACHPFPTTSDGFIFSIIPHPAKKDPRRDKSSCLHMTQVSASPEDLFVPPWLTLRLSTPSGDPTPTLRSKSESLGSEESNSVINQVWVSCLPLEPREASASLELGLRVRMNYLPRRIRVFFLKKSEDVWIDAKKPDVLHRKTDKVKVTV